MADLVKDLLDELAEVLPTLMPKEKSRGDDLPVDDPNFPNDLEPVIRAEPIIMNQPQGDNGSQEDRQDHEGDEHRDQPAPS